MCGVQAYDFGFWRKFTLTNTLNNLHLSAADVGIEYHT